MRNLNTFLICNNFLLSSIKNDSNVKNNYKDNIESNLIYNNGISFPKSSLLN